MSGPDAPGRSGGVDLEGSVGSARDIGGRDIVHGDIIYGDVVKGIDPEKLVATLTQSMMQTAKAAGLHEGTIIRLAQRLKPDKALSLEQAVAELEHAVKIALDTIARGDRSSNDAVFVAKVVNQARDGIALALSGGGYRAMLFHTGVLIRLNELGLLKQVSRVSSVSGGSISAAYLGLVWKKLDWKDGVAQNFREVYVDHILRFSRSSIDVACGLVGFFTQGWLVSRLVSWIYDRALFKGATLQDLPSDDEGPRFIICASNLTTGSLWRFSRPYMADWRVGRVTRPDFPLARAVAASSAFPPVLSPMHLNLRAYDVSDWPEPADSEVRRSVPAFVRSRAVLTDGGAYDNHGLEPIDDWPTLFVSDGGAPHAVEGGRFSNWLSQINRVLAVEDNQVRSLRRRHLIERFQADRAAGKATGTYWSIGTNPEHYKEIGGLNCPLQAVVQLSMVGTRLRDFGDDVRNALVNWGYAICDKSVRGRYDPNLPAAKDWPMPDGLDRIVLG